MHNDAGLPEELFDPAQPLYETVRHRHAECDNTRDALVVTRTPKGWTYKCFKCGLKGFRYHRGRSPRQVTEFLKQLKQGKPGIILEQVRLPKDFTTKLPAIGTLWLSGYDITEEDTKRFGFGYSPWYDRLIMPVYDEDGELIYWQGRNLGKVTEQHPKYLNVRTPKLFGFKINQPDNEVLVIVEDILSAIRVSRASVSTLALLGSDVWDNLIDYAKQFKQVVLWLDPDKRVAMIRFSRRLSSFGVNCRTVLTADKDPKDYNTNQIKTYLRLEESVNHE